MMYYSTILVCLCEYITIVFVCSPGQRYLQKCCLVDEFLLKLRDKTYTFRNIHIPVDRALVIFESHIPASLAADSVSKPYSHVLRSVPSIWKHYAHNVNLVHSRISTDVALSEIQGKINRKTFLKDQKSKKLLSYTPGLLWKRQCITSGRVCTDMLRRMCKGLPSNLADLKHMCWDLQKPFSTIQYIDFKLQTFLKWNSSLICTSTTSKVSAF